MRRNTWKLEHKHGYPYYGAARQEVILSELPRLRDNLRRVGKGFEIALRFRPARNWHDRKAIPALEQFGLNYQGSIPPLEKFDNESRIVICTTTEEVTLQLEAGDIPSRWQNIPEVPRHQMTAEMASLKPARQKEWAHQIVNRITIAGATGAAKKGFTVKVIMPKQESEEGSGPIINRVAAFINYWDSEPLVARLRREARTVATELTDTDNADTRLDVAEISHLHFKKGYKVGTEEEHDEMLLDVLAGTSRLGTTITEYQRPGCRGKSKTSLLISTAGQQVGHSYLDSIVEMLRYMAGRISRHIQVHIHDADRAQHAERAHKNFKENGLMLLANKDLSSDNVSDWMVMAGYAQPCYVVRKTFTNPLYSSKPLYVFKIGMGGDEGRAEARNRMLQEPLKILYKHEVSDQEKKRIDKARAEARELQQAAKPYKVYGTVGRHYQVLPFAADTEWKTIQWPDPPTNKGPEWLQISPPSWNEFMLNELGELVPKKGREAARLEAAIQVELELSTMRQEIAKKAAAQFARTQGAELAVSQSARAQLEKEKEEEAITQVTASLSLMLVGGGRKKMKRRDPQKTYTLLPTMSERLPAPPGGGTLSDQESQEGTGGQEGDCKEKGCYWCTLARAYCSCTEQAKLTPRTLSKDNLTAPCAAHADPREGAVPGGQGIPEDTGL